MRRFLISAAMIGLIGSAGLVIAQDHDQDRGPGPNGAHPAGPAGAPHAAPPAPHPGPAMSGPTEHHNAPAMQTAPNAMRGNNAPPGNNAMRGPGPNNAPNNAMRGPTHNNASNNAMRGPTPNNAPNNAMRGPAPNNGPSNAMRGNNGPRRDFSTARNFHQNFNATKRFHAPTYRQPPGYYSQRWTWGQTLPVAFWARNYWLTDFGAYDLPPPPFGAVWVRVGSDALLIDQYNGQIIEVDYGVFY